MFRSAVALACALTIVLAALSTPPSATAGDEIVVEGTISLGSCFPVAFPICLLRTDAGDEYRILDPSDPLGVRCFTLRGRRVQVAGTLEEWVCDPVEGFGGIGIVPSSIVEIPPPAVCGDANGDGTVDISDAVHLLEQLFLGRAPSNARSSSDVNGDGSVDLSDAVYLLDHLFRGGPALRCP